jgi:DNA-binding beta-propeller fold protein YncE
VRLSFIVSRGSRSARPARSVYNTINLAQAPTVIAPLAGPEGIALAVDAPAGRLYVSEDFSGDIRVYSTANGQYQLLTTITGLNDPSGVAVDSTAHRLFVTELGDVRVYSTNNGQYQYLSTLGSSVGITDPGGLAVDSAAKKLYVAQGTNNVEIFNIPDLSLVYTIAGISQPGGITVDNPHKKVYITENNVGDVRVYSSATYQYLSTIVTGLVTPFGDAVDPVAGKLYVVETNPGDVKIYSTQNPSQTASTISGLNTPWALAIGTGAGVQ